MRMINMEKEQYISNSTCSLSTLHKILFSTRIITMLINYFRLYTKDNILNFNSIKWVEWWEIHEWKGYLRADGFSGSTLMTIPSTLKDDWNDCIVKILLKRSINMWINDENIPKLNFNSFIAFNFYSKFYTLKLFLKCIIK